MKISKSAAPPTTDYPDDTTIQEIIVENEEKITTTEEPEWPESGADCVTTCGEQGLHNGYYWCYISEDTGEWDYCDPQSKGECFFTHL